MGDPPKLPLSSISSLRACGVYCPVKLKCMAIFLPCDLLTGLHPVPQTPS